MSNSSPLRAKHAKLAGALLWPTSSPTKSVDDAENPPFQTQYVDLYDKYTALSLENKQMQEELTKRSETIDDLNLRLGHTERAFRQLEADHQQSLVNHEEDIVCYRRSLEELQRLTQRRLEQATKDILHSLSMYQSLDEKYGKLLRSYKALQSNLELEQNLRALLIDQIEHLTKERDFLLSQVDSNLSCASESDHESLIYSNKRQLRVFGPSSSQSGLLGIMHEGPAGSASSKPALSARGSHSDSDGSVHASHNLSSFVELPDEQNFAASSPIKDASLNSIEVSQNYQFPPTSDESIGLTSNPHSTIHPSLTKPRSRQSLPPRIETLVGLNEDNFVPSPLKLTRPNSTCLDGDLSLSNSASDHLGRKRSSYPKHHSRMNSLDILPIKVEFELAHEQPRSSSSPDRNYFRNLDSVAEGEIVDNSRDLAFMKLNGFTEPNKRDSILTTSSKRSSLLTDFNILSSDITKLEITKLKFELQLLKLHNEKLLSYIGFELQKQKKNIKKLSSKQRLRPTSVEYSDAKLIERLKDMLIHKKRVLRLVSINPILSTKYDSSGQLFQSGVGIGLLNMSPQIDDNDEFMFRSLFIGSLKNDCDDYGFMNHQSKHNLRILSNKDQDYLHETDEKLLKKYKSQTFRRDRQDTDEDSSDLLDEEDFIEDDCEGEVEKFDCDIDNWETNSELGSENSSGSEVSYSQLNRFNQMKYIVLGKEHMKNLKRENKRNKEETMVDEHLKYKFLTLVLGIVVVGFRFTSHTQQQLQGA